MTSEEISAIMQMRCREKKKIGGVTEKKTNEIKEEENKLNGTIDENSNASIVAADDNDNSDLVKEETSPKRNAQRTAKEKVTKYAGDNDDEEDDSVIHGMEIDDGDQESDYMGSDSDTEKKIKKANTKPRKPKSGNADKTASPAKKKSPVTKNGLDDSTENGKNNDETSPKTKTEKPKKPRAKKEPGTTPEKEPVKKEPKKETVKKEPKKAAKRPKPDDSDDDDFPILSNPSTPTKKPRTQRGAAAKKNYHISDDDDDDEDV